MAVWLARVIGVDAEAVTPMNRFADVGAGVWWAPYVEELAVATTHTHTQPALLREINASRPRRMDW